MIATSEFVAAQRSGDATVAGLEAAFRRALRDDRLTLVLELPDGVVVDPEGRASAALDPKVVAALIARREASPLALLSGRERQVLALMAEGLSNAAIADRLVISARTIEAHVAHLLIKLDITDSQETNRRVLAVLAWLRDGQ